MLPVSGVLDWAEGLRVDRLLKEYKWMDKQVKAGHVVKCVYRGTLPLESLKHLALCLSVFAWLHILAGILNSIYQEPFEYASFIKDSDI